ncbi:MAG: hypothetical protein BWK75_00505 [Candidatus Altiarchaeales archaeon A3]|nr:MAG: hypothetical protein BWK75_00505 [Candidatus Altiarchaeales archaeon A3]
MLLKEIEAFAKLGGYKDKNEFIKETIKTFFSARKDLRVKVAIDLYRRGEVSLGRCAEIVGVSYDEAINLLTKKGIKIKRGTESVEELNEGVNKILNFMSWKQKHTGK